MVLDGATNEKAPVAAPQSEHPLPGNKVHSQSNWYRLDKQRHRQRFSTNQIIPMQPPVVKSVSLTDGVLVVTTLSSPREITHFILVIVADHGRTD